MKIINFQLFGRIFNLRIADLLRMKTIFIALLIFSSFNSSLLFSQVTLLIENTVVNNTDSGTWEGVNIARNTPTAFTFRNNSVSSQNVSGYMLQAGDELAGLTNNNLKGQIITGNKFNWNGIVQGEGPETHALFTGYNINSVIKYNYLNNVPSGIQMKSNGMTNITGGIAYNIFNNVGIVAIPVKGMKNVNICNNTFYSSQVFYQTSTFGVWRGLIDIYANTDEGQDPSLSCSSGTKIRNNIFYTTHQIYNIAIYDIYSLNGFDSDYNVFYCESGTPVFNYLGTLKTFAQWQALGYDKHSIAVNPDFIDYDNLVPKRGIYAGTNLGPEFQTGLATTATWNAGSSPATSDQGAIWQAGAYISNAIAASPVLMGTVIENATPFILEMTYNLNLTNIIPNASAFNVQVNSVTRKVNSVSISGSNVLLTLESRITYGDTITIAYTIPSANPLQTAAGDLASSFSSQPVANNCINLKPKVSITSPVNGTSFNTPAMISISAAASDTDGIISKVEFYNGNTKIGEKITSPYSFTWTNIKPGAYQLRVIAIDNSNATAASPSVDVYVNPGNEVNNELINLYPNPNSGYFTIDLITPLKNQNNRISVSNSAGVKVYEGVLQQEELTRQFDLSFLDSGIYILMIVSNEILVVKKFIKN
jgi:uncharacterized repeat protein (TIGR02059 family)